MIKENKFMEDKNGRTLNIGDSVLVELNEGDEFIGRIDGYQDDNVFIIGDNFVVLSERLEFFDENVQLTPVEIKKLKSLVDKGLVLSKLK